MRRGAFTLLSLARRSPHGSIAGVAIGFLAAIFGLFFVRPAIVFGQAQSSFGAVPSQPEPYDDQRWIGSLKPTKTNSAMLDGLIYDLGHCWHKLSIDTRIWKLTIDSRDTCNDPDHGMSTFQLTPVVHNERITQGMYYHLPDCHAEWEGGTFQLFLRGDGAWTFLIDGHRGPGISPRDCKDSKATANP